MTFRICLLLTLFLVITSCSKQQPPSTLEPELKQTKAYLTVANKPVEAVITEVTIKKANLLGRVFLYGSSLQFSSQLDDHKEPQSFMGLALGQAPAQFVIVDDKLRLVTDSSASFESDINHPSRLIQEFPIVSQNDDSITFKADKASPVLDTFLFGDDNKVEKRVSWIRSLEFSEADDLFLIQSSVELVDGSLAEFMETLTPRERQVPADAKPIYDDPSLNPQAARYQFLSSGKVFVDRPDHSRVKTQIANRFLLKNGEPVRWYVTRNIPEKYLPDVKNAVEAWNRYSKAIGIPDLVRFEGLLPEGVAVGDPRYNLIVWDNIADADSAYESQSADPLTGIQSNSLIYLPSAWISLGKSYWENMAVTDGKPAQRRETFLRKLQKRSFLGRPIPLHCLSSAHTHLGIMAQESPEEFGRGLLKTTLFHEVGHSLGLGHNFKGSLAFDPDKPNSLYSYSIMDYNIYNEDEASFASLDSADGPVLEYDRQILSVLYNGGKDVRESDPTLPSCSDADADSTSGGVDPLCIRYDMGKDPTQVALLSLNLLEKSDAHLGRMISLPAALARLPQQLPPPAGVTDEKAAKGAVGNFTKQARIITLIYVAAGGNSLASHGTDALKSLHVFQNGALPSGYDENQMRDRAFSLLEKVHEMKSLPASATDQLKTERKALSDWLDSTAYLSGLPENQREEKSKELLLDFDKTIASAVDEAFSRLRTAMVKPLKYSAAAPWSFLTHNGRQIDMEATILSLLEETAGAEVNGKPRPLSERAEAITALASYAKIPEAKAAAGRLREAVAVEIRTAKDARSREDLRKMAEALAW
jgi:hypothetical protein